MVELIQNDKNLGLAAAQNIGLHHALEQGNPDWIFLVDDDSIVPERMVADMLQSRRTYPERHRIGMIAPRVFDRRSNVESKIIVREGLFRIKRRFCTKKERYCDTALTAIASGSLINVEALRACGMFIESYFIDGIDIEFALRLRSKGWRILIPYKACLSHKLGNKTRHELWGQTFITTNHPASRRYTMYRNRVNIWKKYFFTFPAYVFYDFSVSLFEIAKIVLFENERPDKLKAIMRGIKDGIMTF